MPAGAGTEEAGGGPLADSRPRSAPARGPAGSRLRGGEGVQGERMAGARPGGRLTACPQGISESSWLGARSLAGTRQVWSREAGRNTFCSGADIAAGESEWKGLTSKGCRQHLSGRRGRR